MTTMRAARLHFPTGKLSVEDVAKPAPGAGEVLVKVEAAGVCLSDVHLVHGSLARPRYLVGDTVTLGHEVSGTVAEVGSGVTGWNVGDRVVLQAGEVRGDELWTRGVDYDGGWAEFALARQDTLVALPDAIPFEQGAIIPDAVSTPWGAITTTAHVGPAQPVGVWGVGGLGAHAVQLLRMIGACPVIAVDPAPAARERALAYGADLALDPADPDLRTTIRAATGGLGLEVAFDFAGVTPVREQALRLLAPGGKLVLVGLSGEPITIANSTRFQSAQYQLLGHYGSEPEAVGQLITLQAGGRLDLAASISGVLGLEEAAEAVERLDKKVGDPVRLVLRP
ncbi:zinc-binding dehydrogenase [Catenulispora subtropica]|uniref:Zinc-binding dehydrogenase n=1 Tax=Catenulispora subtropica TaxID=450798 RepID=A0ABP5EMV9_9ACTN